MPIRSPKWPVSKSLMLDAPETAGVYALWAGKELVYIGSARGGRTTLRTRLADHVRYIAPGKQPTHISWEITSKPVQRELELLVEFQEGNSRFPRWNRKGRVRSGRPRSAVTTN
jgi:hypothetical protein